MNDIWIPWNPHEWIQPHYNFVQCNDFIKRFELLLTGPDNNQQVRIAFDSPIYMYRATYQPHIAAVSLSKDHPYYNRWTFFKVINSTYIDWLTEQSYETLETHQYTHFSWVTPQAVIDVISREEPIVRPINAKQQALQDITWRKT